MLRIFTTLRFIIFLNSLLFLPATVAAEVIALSAAQANAMGIQLAVVQVADTAVETRVNAVVELPPHQLHVVTAPQSGLVDRMQVSTGQQVKAGQTLAHLASDGLIGLQSEYLQTLTSTQLAKKALTRDEALFKEGIIAKRRYLETQSAYQALASSLAEKKQILALSGMSKQAIATLGSQRRLRQGLTLTAPINGYVIEQLATVGQRVQAAAPLYKIARLKPLWLTLSVPVEQAMAIQEGMLLTATNPAIEGIVISKLRTLNAHTQTQQVRAEVTNGAELLALGQFVEVTVKHAKQSNSHYRVPRSALVHRGTQAYVFKQLAQGFEPVLVKVVGPTAEHVLVSGPLQVGDKVVTQGTAALKGSWLGVGDE